MAGLTGATTSSLDALSEQYRSITHNLANASTPGYKRRRTLFAELLDTAAAQPVEGAAPAASVTQAQAVDFSQGALTHTGAALDLALEGDGFFALETPEGPLYTRGGTFRINAEGQLVDLAERTVTGQAGPIVIPPSVSSAAVQISRDGNVTAAGESIGRLKIVEFPEASDLTPVAGGCFRATEGLAASDAENTFVHQGFFESSNVSVVEELVGLITVTRMYEANLKGIEVDDERMKTLLDVAMS